MLRPIQASHGKADVDREVHLSRSAFFYSVVTMVYPRKWRTHRKYGMAKPTSFGENCVARHGKASLCHANQMGYRIDEVDRASPKRPSKAKLRHAAVAKRQRQRSRKLSFL